MRLTAAHSVSGEGARATGAARPVPEESMTQRGDGVGKPAGETGGGGFVGEGSGGLRLLQGGFTFRGADRFNVVRVAVGKALEGLKIVNIIIIIDFLRAHACG